MVNLYSEKKVTSPGSYFHQLPYPCYINDQFLFMIQHVMPLCLTISWVYSVSMLVQHIVYEKEQRLKEVSYIYFLILTLLYKYQLHCSFILIRFDSRLWKWWDLRTESTGLPGSYPLLSKWLSLWESWHSCWSLGRSSLTPTHGLFS